MTVTRRSTDRFRPWLVSDRANTLTLERRRPTVHKADEVVANFFSMLRLPSLRPKPAQWFEVYAILWIGRSLRKLDDDILISRVKAQIPSLVSRGFRGRPLRIVAAACREMTGRRLGMRHHPVQMLGGLAMLRGQIVEMATGEGKTITTLIPAVAAALAGVPVHVITVNEYLAERDEEKLSPVFEAFGLSTGLVTEQVDHRERANIYASDVVFTTNKDVTFDYLRDRIALATASEPATTALSALAGDRLSEGAPDRKRILSRGLGMAIVDEIDSVLIDEAQTPLIITEEKPDGLEESIIRLFLDIGAGLKEGVHFRRAQSQRAIRLLPPSEPVLRNLDDVLTGIPITARRERLIQALSAIHLYKRDDQYILRADEDGETKVAIVDEFTGRVMADRQWQRGLHQMIEAKEGLEGSAARDTVAQITYQTFFSRYAWFAGMTGTAQEIARELTNTYGPRVLRLPTHRSIRRRHRRSQIFGRSGKRWQAIVREALRAHRRGQPILIGTRSVEASETIANLLQEAGLEPQVLNARQDRDEAEIVEQAGRPGALTVATNMAGRGTDIPVSREVEGKGGLLVILTEFHSSSRIDRQFFGRSGRQGQRGTALAMVSLDDRLFRDTIPVMVWLTRILTLGVPGRLPGWLADFLRTIAQMQAEGAGRRRRKRTTDRARRLEKALAFRPDHI